MWDIFDVIWAQRRPLCEGAVFVIQGDEHLLQ